MRGAPAHSGRMPGSMMPARPTTSARIVVASWAKAADTFIRMQATLPAVATSVYPCDDLVSMYAALQRFRAENVFNPWVDVDALDATPQPGGQRLARLRLHFDCDPAFVLVGEA